VKKLVVVTARAKLWAEIVSTAIAVFGLVCLFQPFTMSLYSVGGIFLCLGGMVFIITGFIPEGAGLKTVILYSAAVLAVIFGFIGLGILLAPSFLSWMR